MKIRKGFVSNSSSSSFIVLEGDISENCKHLGELYYSRYDGEQNFGWQEIEYFSIYDKLNWAFLIKYSLREYDDRDNINIYELIKFIENSLSPYGIYFVANEDELIELFKEGYIDHQSCNDENAEMWESESKMAQWLLSNQSYIVNGNDNN